MQQNIQLNTEIRSFIILINTGDLCMNVNAWITRTFHDILIMLSDSEMFLMTVDFRSHD